jgi:Mrp family chromosome partitioning ATPase
MISKDQVMTALKEVIDPELHISIVNLRMVKRVDVEGENVKVLVALTVSGCPLSEAISSDIQKTLTRLPGVKHVDVETGVMTKKELEALRTEIQSGMAASRKGQGSGSGMPPGINRLERKGIRNVIAVMSGKGGVGKSFVTAFLAVQLTRLGYKVGILDADVTGPSIAKMFGLKGPLTLTPTRLLQPATTHTGIKVVSMNLILEEPQMPVIVRGPIINSVIRQMFQDVEWGNLHFLLVDLPPGCVSADTLIYANNRLKKISELKPGDDVYSVDANLVQRGKGNVLKARLERKRVLDVVPQGESEVFELRTKSHAMRATFNHPVLVLSKTKNEDSRSWHYSLRWRKLVDLRPSDMIAIVETLPEIKANSHKLSQRSNEHHAGLIRGDGGLEFSTDHVGFEKVTKITPLGRQQVYDLKVEDNQNFIADGVVVHNTSDAPLTVFQSLPLQGVVVVTTPQDLALMVVSKAINMAKTLSEQIAPVKILGLIENMSYVVCPHCGEKIEIFGHGQARDAAEKTGIPFLGAVPIDPEITKLSDEGKIERYANLLFEDVTRAVRVNATELLEPIPGAMPIAWSDEKSK